VGSETCLGCHDGQGGKNVHSEALPRVKKIAADKTCETCHGAGSEHVAAGGDRDDPGFASIKKATTEDCQKCHKSSEVMLWDIGAHAQAGMACNTCHSVHDGKGDKNLKKGATETCIECHKEQGMHMQFPSHHPVKEGKMECVSCHNPHGGENGNLRAESQEELCFKCHAEKAGPFVFEHPPVVEECSNCHEPHGSQADRLLKERQPFLCLRCHPWPHIERTPPTVGFKDPDRLLDRAECTQCHNDIHGSDVKQAFKK